MFEFFSAIFYEPIFNILIVFYRLLGDNLALALIAIAFVSRLVTIPITNRQIKSAEKSREFQDKYNKLKKKFGKNKEKLAQESAKLQAEYLPGQLGGCLPMIFQFVMFYYIFRVLQTLLDPERGVQAFNEVAYSFIDKFPEGSTVNELFLGDLINLGIAPSEVISNIGEAWPYILLVGAVIVAQFFSTKVLSGLSGMGSDKEKEEKEKSKKKKKSNEPEEPDMSEIMQSTSKQMIYFLPLVIGFISFNAPAGLTLYWTVQSGFVIIQRSITKREEIIKWIKTKLNKNQGSEDGEVVKSDKKKKSK